MYNLPSSSTIVIISIHSGCIETPLGKEDESIMRVKNSFCSNILSSIIEILNETLICPAGIVIFKDPSSSSSPPVMHKNKAIRGFFYRLCRDAIGHGDLHSLPFSSINIYFCFKTYSMIILGPKVLH